MYITNYYDCTRIVKTCQHFSDLKGEDKLIKYILISK